MIEREKIWELVADYDYNAIKIGAVASHSALDIADGAVEEGFATVLFAQKGRERTYTEYFKASRAAGKIVSGVVDECIVYEKFDDLMQKTEQKKIVDSSILFVPNRALTSYIPVEKIESDFFVPLVGSRNLLRTEERGEERDYYWLLEKASLPYPEVVEDAKEIKSLVIVKLPHAVKKLERGFFTCASYEEYNEKSKSLLRNGVITKTDLKNARIERYIVGPVFNLDFFYSPLRTCNCEIELLGVDWRFETSLDGFVRLPAEQQLHLSEGERIPEYTVCGHNSATLRESLLEKAFALAEKYVDATKKYFPPGIIGPFCLQTCVDKDLKFYVYDVAPRIGGGTNVHVFIGHPYGNILWRTRMSTGRRLAVEIKKALELEKLELILT